MARWKSTGKNNSAREFPSKTRQGEKMNFEFCEEALTNLEFSFVGSIDDLRQLKKYKTWVTWHPKIKEEVRY